MKGDTSLEGFVRDSFFAHGVNIQRQTDPAQVLLLIQSLHPLQSAKELIRIGGDGDGGYLVPDDLAGIEYCFSPGVSTRSTFENELADRGIRSFLADYSVEAPPVSRPEFVFDKMFLGATDQGHFFTLQSWKDKYLRAYLGDLMLQMDIEGFEYEVILSTPPALLNQFRILVIEFHSLEKLFDKFGFTILSSCFQKLLQQFYVVHIHPNNASGSVRRGEIEVPRVVEFTFLNKSRGILSRPAAIFPHPLDHDNVPDIAGIPLPACWYSHDSVEESALAGIGT